MADEKKSFWEIFAIVVTAIAAVLAGLSGVAAVITALNGDGKEGAAKPETAPSAQAASAAQPSSVSSANDEAARRAKAEAEAAKAEAERAKTEAAEAKARAAELERKLAEIASAKVKAEATEAAAAKERAVELTTKLSESKQPAEPQQRDTMTDEAIGMVLVYVPGGCFMMGQSNEEKRRLFVEVGLHDYNKNNLDEAPQHNVCVGSFWMGKYEVTKAQWKNVMEGNLSPSEDDKKPVTNISWDEAQKFIETLNKGVGKAYRLPTEAEWEYACRANSPGSYCGGDDLDAVAWYYKNSGSTSHAVGGKKANAFGLHDMSGNVWEWCADWYDSGYYASSPKDNPQGPDSGEDRVLRGGSYFYGPLACRAVNRPYDSPRSRHDSIGFRLALPVR